MVRYVTILLLISCSTTEEARRPLPKECPKPKVIDQTTLPWEDRDTFAVNTANDNCKRIYSRLHCAREVRKVTEKGYQIICYKPD